MEERGRVQARPQEAVGMCARQPRPGVQRARFVHHAHACALLLTLALFMPFPAVSSFSQKQITSDGVGALQREAAARSTLKGYQPASVSSNIAQQTLSASRKARFSRARMLSSLCPSGTFEWPKASGLCWNKRETFGAAQGPANNVFAANNVLLDSSTDTLTLKMEKKGTRTSCAEVILDRSLGYGDYIWQTATDPNTMHPSMVGASFIYADSSREFDIVYSKWSDINSQKSVQYTMHPETPGSQLEFYGGSGGQMTHRLRWSGSTVPGQVRFETWTSAGVLLVSWTAQSGTNFTPGDERVHLNHWIANPVSVPSSSTYTLNCFSFCPVGQEAQCSAPLGSRPTCGAAAVTIATPPASLSVNHVPLPSPIAESVSPNPRSPSSTGVGLPPAQPPALQLSPCPVETFRWPVDKDYCWHARDSNGEWQGPGNNLFKPQNANVDPDTGALVLTVAADAGGILSAGEVFLDRSLGLGDYVFTVQTDPRLMHHNLVGSPFIYADPNAAGAREFDIEYSRWGNADIESTQFVVQPYTTNKEHRFNLTGEMFTHRIKWSGTSTPDQVQFETWSVAGQQVHAWTNSGGNNFVPGDERVHINHWVYGTAGVPAQNYFVLTCFKFCPLGDDSCGIPGSNPIC